jgi:Flp pilus assembly secretin CpaC
MNMKINIKEMIMRANPAKKVLLVILSIFIFSSVAHAGVVTEVGIDKSTIITVKKPYERISVANPAIADVVTITPTQLMLVGKTLGATTLIVWMKGEEPTFFDIRVVPLKVKEPDQVLLEVIVADIDRKKAKDFGFGALVKGSSGEGTAPGLVSGGTPGGIVGGVPGTRTSPGITGFNLTNFTPQIAVSHFASGISAFLTAMEEPWKDTGKAKSRSQEWNRGKVPRRPEDSYTDGHGHGFICHGFDTV